MHAEASGVDEGAPPGRCRPLESGLTSAVRPELFGQRGGEKGDTVCRALSLSRVLVCLAGDTGGVESELLGQVG